jgi:hypothetical protein
MTIRYRSPVIIIGMHRSGTTLVTELLEQQGLFFGRNHDVNHEAWFFLSLNRWLFRKCGARWDFPENVDMLMGDSFLREEYTALLARLIDSPMFYFYKGMNRSFEEKAMACDYLWGWKDPRNTFTLPLWLDLFPQAKVIHVVRNGVDVAQSLKVRYDKSMIHLEKIRARKLYYLARMAHGEFGSPMRCSSIEGGFELWLDYVLKAKVNLARVESLGGGIHEIKFEDFSENSEMVLRKLFDFCELEVTDSNILKSATTIKMGRVFAYKENDELVKFAESKKDHLEMFGY